MNFTRDAPTAASPCITNVQTIRHPSGGHRSDISAYAIPQLHSQVTSAQNASIQGVGGATYPTQGFESSLQSAVDAAHFGQHSLARRARWLVSNGR